MNNFDPREELARLTTLAAIDKVMISSNPEKYIKQANDRYYRLFSILEEVERALTPNLYSGLPIIGLDESPSDTNRSIAEDAFSRNRKALKIIERYQDKG